MIYNVLKNFLYQWQCILRFKVYTFGLFYLMLGCIPGSLRGVRSRFYLTGSDRLFDHGLLCSCICHIYFVYAALSKLLATRPTACAITNNIG